MTWPEIALGVFVGMCAYHIAGRILGAVLVVFARRSQTMIRWLEEDERKDAPLRDAIRRGQR